MLYVCFVDQYGGMALANQIKSSHATVTHIIDSIFSGRVYLAVYAIYANMYCISLKNLYLEERKLVGLTLCTHHGALPKLLYPVTRL